MNKPQPQQLQSLDPRDYKTVVCVAGTRHYNDRKFFHAKIVEFLELCDGPVLFVSGAASSGADDLIIRWCQHYGYPCLKMPADWENVKGVPNFNKKTAGFVRNAEMAEVVSFLIVFFDGASPGTSDMISRCEAKGVPVITYEIKVEKPAYVKSRTHYSQDPYRSRRLVGPEARNTYAN